MSIEWLLRRNKSIKTIEESITELQKIIDSLRRGQANSAHHFARIQLKFLHPNISAIKHLVEELKSGRYASQLSLELPYDNIYDEGAKYFSELIQSEHCPQKFHLSLEGNQISSKGAQWLAKAMSKDVKPNRELSIRLSHNTIGNKGAEFFSDLMLHSQHFKALSLDLTDNGIDYEGAKLLANAIQSAKLPEKFSLDISSNPIDDVGAEFFAEAMRSEGCSSGFSLIFGGNNFSPEGEKLLVEAFRETIVCRRLYLGAHSDKELIAKLNLEERNQKAQELIKQCNDFRDQYKSSSLANKNTAEERDRIQQKMEDSQKTLLESLENLKEKYDVPTILVDKLRDEIYTSFLSVAIGISGAENIAAAKSYFEEIKHPERYPELYTTWILCLYGEKEEYQADLHINRILKNERNLCLKPKDKKDIEVLLDKGFFSEGHVNSFSKTVFSQESSLEGAEGGCDTINLDSIVGSLPDPYKLPKPERLAKLEKSKEPSSYEQKSIDEIISESYFSFSLWEYSMNQTSNAQSKKQQKEKNRVLEEAGYNYH